MSLNDIWSITGIVTLTLIVIQILAPTTLIDCSDTSIHRQVLHSLSHGSIMHLLINIFTFLQLYSLEEMLGSKNYLILIITMLLLTSIVYWILNKFLYGSEIICSVGFSGVLFGLLVWSRIVLNQGRFEYKDLWFWAIILLVPALMNPQISLLGHISGFLVGLISWPILSPILL